MNNLHKGVWPQSPLEEGAVASHNIHTRIPHMLNVYAAEFIPKSSTEYKTSNENSDITSHEFGYNSDSTDAILVILNINKTTFTSMIQSYLLSFKELIWLSYPVESPMKDGLVVSYNMLRIDDCGNSIDDGEDIFKNKNCTKMLNKKYHEYFHNVPVERTCVRCKGRFLVTNKEYITMDKCCYHWGKFIYENTPVAGYECCGGTRNSVGCTNGNLHVWSGKEIGVNGPYDGFVRTKFRENSHLNGNFDVYALDCEMCFTVQGLEVTKVTVVNMLGKLVYDSFVKPEHNIVDYNSRFSGISAKDLEKSGVKSLKQIQNDLMGFISANTVLVGHGLENDLRALKILHNRIVDTSYLFPHYRGLPYRRSLKNLAQCLLKNDVLTNGNRKHDNYENAITCMELFWWRIYNDYRHILIF